MIGIAAAQVILRNFFDTGLFWGDSAVRVMVLWVAMLGAMVASRTDLHIRIDIAGRFIGDRLRPHVHRIVSAFTCIVLLLFAWSSFQFVRFEYEDETLAFGAIPAWACEVIMPLGGAVMAVRYFMHTLWPKP
jgi:TRAP-type C4-dicarboxylate transport system permease small subunit